MDRLSPTCVGYFPWWWTKDFHLGGEDPNRYFIFECNPRIFVWILMVNPRFLLESFKLAQNFHTDFGSAQWFDGCDHTHVLIPRYAPIVLGPKLRAPFGREKKNTIEVHRKLRSNVGEFCRW